MGEAWKAQHQMLARPELVKGFDLDTLVRHFGPLPSERVVHLLAQACHSLEDAHKNGLVHRDVKPANIFTGSVALTLLQVIPQALPNGLRAVLQCRRFRLSPDLAEGPGA